MCFAQLVERQLPKLNVASSNLVIRYYPMKKRLYFGLECPQCDDVIMIHYPLITTLPRNDHEIQKGLMFAKGCSHIIVTSKMAVRYLFDCHPIFAPNVCFISVGKATTEEVKKYGNFHILTSLDECQEGVILLISSILSPSTSFFWPHSSLSRNDLKDFLKNCNAPFFECVFYETHKTLPNNHISFDDVDELFFSSPSTVEAFFEFFKKLPEEKQVLTQGKVTERTLKKYTKECLW